MTRSQKKLIRLSTLSLLASLTLAIGCKNNQSAAGDQPSELEVLNGLCLGVVGIDSFKIGASAEVYHCGAHEADPGLDSAWKVVQFSGDYVQIRNRLSDKCLAVRGFDQHAPGALVEVYDCLPWNADKLLDTQWLIYPVPNEPYVWIKNRVSNLCLGVQGVDKHGLGAAVEVFHCSPYGGDPGYDNQWSIDESNGGYGHIHNRVPYRP